MTVRPRLYVGRALAALLPAAALAAVLYEGRRSFGATISWAHRDAPYREVPLGRVIEKPKY